MSPRARKSQPHRKLGLIFVLGWLMIGNAHAASWRFAVPPFLPKTELQAQYAPLLEYLGASTGESFELVTSANYQAFWSVALKGGSYDLVLDNAPMIDLRVERQKCVVIAKVAGVVSQSIVTNENASIFETDELVSKKVASVASPNLSALAMFQIFPNPMRQPDFTYTQDARAAVDMVLKNQAVAAIVPTPIAIQFTNLNVATTTKQIPHLAVAAAPSMPADIRKKVQDALLKAHGNAAGQKALTAINTERFEPASNADYSGYAKWLEGAYGY